MKNLLFISLTTIVFLTGCNEFKAKDKGYYLEHIEIAKSRVEECKKNGAASENEKIDCSNAQKAVNEVISKSNNPIIGNEKKVTDW